MSDGRKNLFHDPKGRNGMSKLFESYLAGQVASLMELAPMYWPTINSYKRLVDGFWAPVKPTWGLDNRTASFRVLSASPKSTRLETRCPGADMNPYLAAAAVLAAGLDGVEKKLKLTAKPIHGTNQGAEDIPRAPRTLIETTRIFRDSALARDWFGDDFVDHYAATREWEWRQWLDAVTDWEMKRYFEIIWISTIRRLGPARRHRLSRASAARTARAPRCIHVELRGGSRPSRSMSVLARPWPRGAARSASSARSPAASWSACSAWAASPGPRTGTRRRCSGCTSRRSMRGAESGSSAARACSSTTRGASAAWSS